MPRCVNPEPGTASNRIGYGRGARQSGEITSQIRIDGGAINRPNRGCCTFRILKETGMAQSFSSSPALALAAGVLILVKPKLLNYIVAAYLISDGLLRITERRA